MCNLSLQQCFSTGVPRHTSVPWNFFRCAAKSYNVLYLIIFVLSSYLSVPPNFFYYYSVPLVQNAWKTLVYSITQTYTSSDPIKSRISLWKFSALKIFHRFCNNVIKPFDTFLWHSVRPSLLTNVKKFLYPGQSLFTRFWYFKVWFKWKDI